MRNEILNEIWNKIGWDKYKDNDEINSLLRPLIIYHMGKYGNKEIIKESINKFNNFYKIFIKNPNKNNEKLLNIIPVKT